MVKVRGYWLAVIGMLCMAWTAQAADVVYTADNSSIFANPERGFITMVEGHLSTSEPYAVKGEEATLDQLKDEDKGSLVLVLYYLENYKETGTLPQVILDAFDEDMQVLREKGMKCIIRYAYTNSDEGEIGYDASLDIIEQHIAQYKPLWEANADVIFCFQAGFIGAWGEWYYSSHFGNKESHINDARRAFLDTLIAAVPHDRCIQLRTPQFKTEYLKDEDALTAEEAYEDTPKARLGQHNDAFLNGASNQGTYADTAKQKPWLAQETLYVPIGGENNVEEEDAVEYGAHDVVVAEMSRLHWTFIQGYFREYVTNLWRTNGTFDELNRNLGYRYQLVNGSFSDEVAQGGKLSVNLQIRNAGYAPLYNARPAYVVLVDSHKSIVERIQIESDPRTWKPNGAVSEVNEQVTIPASVPQGKYNLYLWLPDAYASLEDDARYAVRFANTDIWDAETGMNDLGAQVTITEPAYVPGTPIAMPATFNKANVTDFSDDMTWYNGDYFDFGPEDAENLDRWAEWTVEVKYPGKYIVSENMASVWVEDPEGDWLIGHSWKLQLLNGETQVSTYTTEELWDEGEISYDVKWDLSLVPKGVYRLRVQNVTPYAQPKLKSLSLEYDGEPTGVNGEWTKGEWTKGYDILGRPVDASYKGIVVMQGKKIIR